MVEFDDGDRGRISLANIRLLPPGYQIHCEYYFKNTDEKTTKNRQNKWITERQRDILSFNTSLSGAEPSPALLSPGRRSRRSSTQDKKDTPTDKSANEDPAGRTQEKRPGETSFTFS